MASSKKEKKNRDNQQKIYTYKSKPEDNKQEADKYSGKRKVLLLFFLQ